MPKTKKVEDVKEYLEEFLMDEKVIDYRWFFRTLLVRGIILNTTGEVKIGNDSATSNLVHGDILYKILQQILNQLRVPIQCGTMLGGFTSYSGATTAQKQLKDLLSSKYFITKSPYK